MVLLCLLASPRSPGKILMVLMCIALCQKLYEQIQSLLRHSMCAVVRAMAASCYWAMWGPVIFVVTRSSRSSFSSFDVSLLIFDDVWWFLIMIFIQKIILAHCNKMVNLWSKNIFRSKNLCVVNLVITLAQFQSDVRFFHARYFFACSQHWRWCCWAKSKDCTLTEVMLLGLIDIGDGSS